MDSALKTQPAGSTGALASVFRRILLRSPLFLPLLAVVGSLLGGLFWCVAVFALLTAAVLKLWRIGIAVLLCALLAILQQERQHHAASTLQDYLSAHTVVELHGTVVRQLSSGCVIQSNWKDAKVVVRGKHVSWRVGDYVRFRAESRPLRPPLLPGMFDASRWMQQQGVAVDLNLVQGEYLAHPFSWASVCGMAAAVREALAERLMPVGTETDARRQVLCALVLGDKTRAEDETMLDFRKGGCLHAFAVSGLHVGLLAGLLWGFLRLCRVRVGVARIIILLLCGLYIVMTGLAVPAVRAYMMAAIVLGGAILHKRVSLLNTWCFAALLILLPQPYQIYNAGFQLSFIVYAAICVGIRFSLRESPWFGPDAYIPYRIRTQAERRLSSFELTLRGVIIISLWAWLVSLPITIAQFHTLNTHSFITNILISPILPLVMATGLLAMLFGFIPLIGPLLSAAALYSAQMLIGVVSLCGALPAAYLPALPPQPVEKILLISTGYGESACMLGNGGLLIAGGNAQAAHFTIEPAVFHAGFTPTGVLLPKPSARRAEMAAVLTDAWPRLCVIDAVELKTKTDLVTKAGVFSIYPAPSTLPRKPMQNVSPVVVWQRAKSRVLYIGDASALTFESIPEDERKADILILGYNKRMPVADAETIRSVGAATIILLPFAHHLKTQIGNETTAEVRCLSYAPAVLFYD